MLKLNIGNNITRLEIIDSIGGREYVNINIEDIILDIQDNGKTLKIFTQRKIEEEGVNILC